jgi:hypothetical protein
MEGDMRDIVLARLEKRLKEKDDEIRSLKGKTGEDLQAEVAALRIKVSELESEVVEYRVTLSEVMKKVGSLEGLVNSLLLSTVAADDDNGEDLTDPDMLLDGSNFPQELPTADKHVAAEDNNGQKDGTRFFHLSKNS